MNLTEHFTEAELRVQGESNRIRENALQLCAKVLEPIRAQFLVPVIITSGFRNPQRNKDAGGVGDSWHLFEDFRSACDFKVIDPSTKRTSKRLIDIFDWLRLASDVPFDRVILYYNADGSPRHIHVQYKRGTHHSGKRLAFVKLTNSKRYHPQVCI
jgi:hypothetical protein